MISAFDCLPATIKGPAENFPITLWFLPRPWRKAIRVIYAFARQADDIADEGRVAPIQRLAELHFFENQLDFIKKREKSHLRGPLFLALAQIVEENQLPINLFSDLLSAFRQDVQKSDYATQAELMDYCRRSANPIGRLLLHIVKEAHPSHCTASDALCTALQLLNFWQDLVDDLRDRKRCYLPKTELDKFGICPEAILNGTVDPGHYKALIQSQLEIIQSQLTQAQALTQNLKGIFGFQIRMVYVCAQRVLNLLWHRNDYLSRPKLTFFDWIFIFLKTLRLSFQSFFRSASTVSGCAQHYCQEKVAKSGSSFYYSFLFLPKPQYEAIVSIYAFCREVDDIVDDCQELSVAEAKLGWWQDEIEALYQQKPTHPITQALLPQIEIYQLPKSLFLEVLNGMWMDLHYQGYATVEDLKLYAHCVASAVGLLVTPIFGYQNLNTLSFAKNLGLALQWINIIRDVGEDSARGRLYLPEEDLLKFDLRPADFFNKKDSPAIRDCLRFQAQRARQFYQTALSALAPEDRQTQSPALIMAAIYFTLLDEIEKTNFDVLNQRISLTPLRKLWIAWKTARRIRRAV